MNPFDIFSWLRLLPNETKALVAYFACDGVLNLPEARMRGILHPQVTQTMRTFMGTVCRAVKTIQTLRRVCREWNSCGWLPSLGEMFDCIRWLSYDTRYRDDFMSFFSQIYEIDPRASAAVKDVALCVLVRFMRTKLRGDNQNRFPLLRSGIPIQAATDTVDTPLRILRTSFRGSETFIRNFVGEHRPMTMDKCADLLYELVHHPALRAPARTLFVLLDSSEGAPLPFTEVIRLRQFPKQTSHYHPSRWNHIAFFRDIDPYDTGTDADANAKAFAAYNFDRRDYVERVFERDTLTYLLMEWRAQHGLGHLEPFDRVTAATKAYEAMFARYHWLNNQSIPLLSPAAEHPRCETRGFTCMCGSSHGCNSSDESDLEGADDQGDHDNYHDDMDVNVNVNNDNGSNGDADDASDASDESSGSHNDGMVHRMVVTVGPDFYEDVLIRVFDVAPHYSFSVAPFPELNQIEFLRVQIEDVDMVRFICLNVEGEATGAVIDVSDD